VGLHQFVSIINKDSIVESVVGLLIAFTTNVSQDAKNVVEKNYAVIIGKKAIVLNVAELLFANTENVGVDVLIAKVLLYANIIK
jgi:hypothetical protein